MYRNAKNVGYYMIGSGSLAQLGDMISFPFQHWMSEEDFQYMLASTREVLAALR